MPIPPRIRRRGSADCRHRTRAARSPPGAPAPASSPRPWRPASHGQFGQGRKPDQVPGGATAAHRVHRVPGAEVVLRYPLIPHTVRGRSWPTRTRRAPLERSAYSQRRPHQQHRDQHRAPGAPNIAQGADQGEPTAENPRSLAWGEIVQPRDRQNPTARCVNSRPADANVCADHTRARSPSSVTQHPDAKAPRRSHPPRNPDIATQQSPAAHGRGPGPPHTEVRHREARSASSPCRPRTRRWQLLRAVQSGPWRGYFADSWRRRVTRCTRRPSQAERPQHRSPPPDAVREKNARA